MNDKLIALSVSLALFAGGRDAQETAIPSLQSIDVARVQQVARNAARVLQRGSTDLGAIVVHAWGALRALVPPAPLSRLARSLTPVMKWAMRGWRAAFRQIMHPLRAALSRVVLSSRWHLSAANP
jgi:hypothetical protein